MLQMEVSELLLNDTSVDKNIPKMRIQAGILCSDEYDYEMGDDGVLRRKKKIQSSNSNGSGGGGNNHTAWGWIIAIIIAIIVIGAISENNKSQQSSYQVYKGDCTWYQADEYARNNGERLATINSKKEFNKLCELAEANDIKVMWVGATRDTENWETSHWNDGEEISYTKWYPGEPTYYNAAGIAEDFLMVFCVNGEWYFNDAENDVTKYYSGKIGFITEQ